MKTLLVINEVSYIDFKDFFDTFSKENWVDLEIIYWRIVLKTFKQNWTEINSPFIEFNKIKKEKILKYDNVIILWVQEYIDAFKDEVRKSFLKIWFSETQIEQDIRNFLWKITWYRRRFWEKYIDFYYWNWIKYYEKRFWKEAKEYISCLLTTIIDWSAVKTNRLLNV